MSDQTITLLILVLAVAVFVWNRLPVGIVALGVALALWATDVLTLDQAVEGFGNPTVVLIAALFVVAEALEAAGITTWAGQQLMRHAGDSRWRLMALLMVAVALLSALITPNGAVAAMVPMVVVLTVRLGEPPSKYLMPVAFAAHAGALLVLTGSPVSLLVSSAAADAGERGFAFFELALVGVPLLVGTILVVIFIGQRVLPNRDARSLTRDLGELPSTLASQYIQEEELARLTINAGSPYDGVDAGRISVPPDSNLHLLSVQNGNGGPLVDDDDVHAGDVLVVRGSIDGIETFARANGLGVARGTADKPIACGLVSRDFGVAEVIVAPRSNYIGERVFPGMITESGQLVVLAIQRHGEDLGMEQTVLRAGDSLLLQGSWDALDQHTADPNVLLVDTPDAIRRQTIALGARAVPALAVLAVMVVLLTTGIVPAAVACLLAAIAMVLLRVVTVDEAHRSMSWTTIILVAGMIPLSTAITQTGAADFLADGFVDSIGGGGTHVVLLGLFVVTVILGQMISNTATALILIPIALSIASEMNISPLALLMCVNVAAAASLFTPVATPANMMVMGPAGYKFNDYWKLGLPVLVVYLIVGVLLVPLFWPL